MINYTIDPTLDQSTRLMTLGVTGDVTATNPALIRVRLGNATSSSTNDENTTQGIQGASIRIIHNVSDGTTIFKKWNGSLSEWVQFAVGTTDIITFDETNATVYFELSRGTGTPSSAAEMQISEFYVLNAETLTRLP